MPEANKSSVPLQAKQGFIMAGALMLLAVVIIIVATWPGHLLASVPLLFASLVLVRAIEHYRDSD